MSTLFSNNPLTYISGQMAQHHPFGHSYLMPPAEVMNQGLNVAAQGKLAGPFLGVQKLSSIGVQKALKIYQKSQGNLLTLAPPGTGKSSSLAIPCALSWPGVQFILDPKGEILRASIGFRSGQLAQHCVVFDPTGMVYEQGGHRWNVFDELLDDYLAFRDWRAEDGPLLNSLLEDITFIGRLLIERDANGNSNEWSGWADQLFRVGVFAALSRICRQDKGIKQVTFTNVLKDILSSDEDFSAALDELMAHDDPYLKLLAGLIGTLKIAPEQLTGIRTTLFGFVEMMAYPNLRRATEVSDVSFKNLRRGGKDVTVYVVVPPHEIATYKPFIRVLMGWFLRCLEKNYVPEIHDSQPPALFLMDEVAQLGYLDVLESEMQIARGYNIKFWFFIQSLSFLQSAYPKSWKMFFETSECVSTFGLNDIDAAEMFSRMIGSSTVMKTSLSENSGTTKSTAYMEGQSTSHSTNRSTSHAGLFGPSTYTKGSGQTMGSNNATTWTDSSNSGQAITYDFVNRRVLMADEITRLPEYDQLIFMRGKPAIQCSTVYYQDTQEMRARSELPIPGDLFRLISDDEPSEIDSP